MFIQVNSRAKEMVGFAMPVYLHLTQDACLSPLLCSPSVTLKNVSTLRISARPKNVLALTSFSVKTRAYVINNF